MTHLFICDTEGCGLQSGPSTKTGGSPKGWTWRPEPAPHGSHECNGCSTRRALARVEAAEARGDVSAAKVAREGVHRLELGAQDSSR